MSYQRIQLLLISLFCLLTAIYFLLGNEIIHKVIGLLALVILIGLNGYYYLNSTSWLHKRRK